MMCFCVCRLLKLVLEGCYWNKKLFHLQGYALIHKSVARTGFRQIGVDLGATAHNTQVAAFSEETCRKCIPWDSPKWFPVDNSALFSIWLTTRRLNKKVWIFLLIVAEVWQNWLNLFIIKIQLNTLFEFLTQTNSSSLFWVNISGPKNVLILFLLNIKWINCAYHLCLYMKKMKAEPAAC